MRKRSPLVLHNLTPGNPVPAPVRDPKQRTETQESARFGCYCISAVAGALAILVIVIIIFDRVNMPQAIGSMPFAGGSAAFVSTTTCPTALAVTLPRELDALRARLHARADATPAVEWSMYAAEPARFAGRRVLVRRAHTHAGTLFVRTAALLELAEDIAFCPRPGNDYRPTGDDVRGALALRLGFFAAIVVEAADVVIDLHGHTLEQCAEHALEQRAPFALVSLANVPFVPGQGPTLFGTEVRSANGFVLEGGVLGRSSHHGVHGNGARRVLVRDVHLRGYEVAAIALNGASDVVLERVHAHGQFTAIPVMGTYSNARQLPPIVARVLADGAALGISALKRLELERAAAHLHSLTAQVRVDVRATGHIDAVAHPEAAALFANTLGVPDGNSYGLVLHPLGASVTNFWSSAMPATASTRVLVVGSTFAATRAHVVEVVALFSPEGTAVRGPVGELFRLVDNAGRVAALDETGGGRYRPNALADVQLALMDAALDVTNTSVRARYFGTLHGPASFLHWARGAYNASTLVRTHNYTYARNGDTMFHVNKGTIGVRIDGAHDVCLDNVAVDGVTNTGARGRMAALPGEASDEAAAYTSCADGGHPAQGVQYGYMGADSRGLSFSRAERVYVRGVRVRDVASARGFARGIDVFNDAARIYLADRCSVTNVTTLLTDSARVLTGDYVMGPKVGAAIGVHVTTPCSAWTYGVLGVRIEHVTAGAFDQAHMRSVGTDDEQAAVNVIAMNVYGELYCVLGTKTK